MNLSLLCTVALFLAGTLSALPEKHYQAIAAKALGGKTEITMGDGTRCDIVTDDCAIEVDWSAKSSQAIGQALGYGFQASKRAGIILIIANPTDTKEAIRVNSILRHYKLPVTLWTIDIETETLKLFSKD